MMDDSEGTKRSTFNRILQTITQSEILSEAQREIALLKASEGSPSIVDFGEFFTSQLEINISVAATFTAFFGSEANDKHVALNGLLEKIQVQNALLSETLNKHLQAVAAASTEQPACDGV